MDGRKKLMLAISLVVLWAGVATWQWRFMEEPVRVPLTNVTGHPSSGRQAAAMGTGWRVNLGLLTSADAQREARFTVPRNIFALPRSDGALPLSHDTALENRQDSVSDETAAEHMDEEESAQYRYLGFLRIGDSRQKNKDIAVLSKGDEVMILRVGDRVDDHVILRAVSAGSVTMRDTDTRMEKTLLLSDETVEQE
jgi:hypothetical protein